MYATEISSLTIFQAQNSFTYKLMEHTLSIHLCEWETEKWQKQ